MLLSTAQQTTLKTWLTANSAGLGPRDVAALLNAVATPNFWVWRSFVSEHEIYDLTSSQSTNWSWTTYGALVQGARDGWNKMASSQGGGLKPYLANVRTAVAAVFTGAGVNATQLAHLLACGMRPATVVEQLFTTGTGTTGTPGFLGVGADGVTLLEGPIDQSQVAVITNSP